MIVRSWRGSVRKEDGDRYFEYLKQTGLIAYQHTPGNKGVLVLRRAVEERAEFVLLSFWESLEAVTNFAGPNPDNVIFYPEDETMLVEYDDFVTHYELLGNMISVGT
jgi:heme-degrading monooxygenase HmoA